MNQRTAPQRSISVAITLSAAVVMYGIGISVGPVRLLPIMALFVAAAAWFGGLIFGWATLTLIVVIALLFGEVWVSAIRFDVLVVFLIMGVALLHGSAIAFRTRRREVEVKDALALQQDLLRVVIDGVPMAIGYMDCDQRYRLWNRAFGDLVGGSDRKDAHIRELFGEETYTELLPMRQTQRCLIPMTGYYKWDRTVRPPIPHFIQAQDGRVLCAAGLWERWEHEEAEDPPFESFTILTHPNAAIPAPLTPDGPVFVEGAAAGVWLSGPSMLAGHALRRSKTPVLGSYAVSHAYRDRARSDYTLIEPRAASYYLEPEADAFHVGAEDED